MARISGVSSVLSHGTETGSSGDTDSSFFAVVENPNRTLLETFFVPRMLEDRDVEALFSDGGLTFRDAEGDTWTVEIVKIAEKTDCLFVKVYKKETFRGIFLREMVSPRDGRVFVTETILQKGETSPSRDQSVVRSLSARQAFPFEAALADIQERVESPETPSVTLDEKVETFIEGCLSGAGTLKIEALFSETFFAGIFALLPIENKLVLEAIFNKIPADFQEEVKALMAEERKHGVERPLTGQEFIERGQNLIRTRTAMDGRQEELNAPIEGILDALDPTLGDREKRNYFLLLTVLLNALGLCRCAKRESTEG